MARNWTKRVSCKRCGKTGEVPRGYSEAWTCEACNIAISREQIVEDLRKHVCLVCGNDPSKHPIPGWGHALRLVPDQSEIDYYKLTDEEVRGE